MPAIQQINLVFPIFMPMAIRISFRGSPACFRRLSMLSLAVLTACAVQPTTQPPARDAMETPAAAPLPSPQPAQSAPAPQRPPSPEKAALLSGWVDQQSRLYRVAAPLLIENTALCKRQARNLLGLTAKTRYSYGKGFVAEAQSALGLNERLKVMDVLPGSGAERSGIRKGDVLLAVDGKPLSQGPNAERDGAVLVNAAMRGRSSVTLNVERNGEQLSIATPLTNACAFGIELGDSDLVNSYADGFRVMINRGMLNFVRTDEELAYVLSKEIAHNTLTRSDRPRMSSTINKLRVLREDRSAPASMPALQPYSPVLDATADKLSLYMLTRAGYGTAGTIDFWKRLAAGHPATMPNSYTALHPSTAYRVSVMNQTLEAIKWKRHRKQAMVP
ncbi:MAG TPA: M48 family metallopeptidase [Noviherbaspirillum sp.]|jgi:membrane-associated protease RseP (regulator of RpoE activity)|uniref:M48 family metallopeptidase n=1 Tax=Noviherbaspirillum sp. TaxID=1926288 RepID=UPI002DDD3263|nr:M48 family metallopeptidase [Noviherbaspirillum sp.]HEV2611760.1 M48 family metallopeptidase [Noviherbaspirillum sp.]